MPTSRRRADSANIDHGAAGSPRRRSFPVTCPGAGVVHITGLVTGTSDTYVVIAAFNEAQVIRGVVGEVAARGYPVVVVDDGSRDDTAASARMAGVTVVRHAVNLGQGAALQTGIEYALRRGAHHIVTSTRATISRPWSPRSRPMTSRSARASWASRSSARAGAGSSCCAWRQRCRTA
jgi:hypothetical protein